MGPLRGQTTFTYDPNGNLLTVSDAWGNTTTHEYDSMDRLSRRIDPLGKPETFAYDGNGNLTTTTDRKNQPTTFTYDALNRRTRAEYADGAVATFTYDAVSRLTQADDTTDPHRPITLTYDLLDRLLTETTTLGTVGYAYDTAGRRTSMTVSGQAPVMYTYDHNARLRTITQAPLTPVDIQYDAGGRRTLLTLPNGVSTEYQYDLASRLTALIYRNALGSLGDLQYGYDGAGNRTSVGGSFARTLLPDAITSATYDQGNRQLAFGPSTMTFDDNGNLLTQTDPSGTVTFTWDARNRLTGLSGSAVAASFGYDTFGRRAQKTIDGGTTAFRYDGLDIVKETDGVGDVSYLRTLAIDEVLSRTDENGTVSYLADALGTTVALSDPTGGLPTTYTFEPFGRTEATGAPSTNAVRFTGREDDGTGLYYYRARYYDPARARFIGSDPIRIAGGLNMYAYANGDPVSLRDPSGLEVTMTCRPVQWAGAFGMSTPVHCSVFVWHWETDRKGNRWKKIDRQFSLCAWGRRANCSPLSDTSQDDYRAFNGGLGGHNYDIPLPANVTQPDFDYRVTESGERYRGDPYWPTGPNSNTAAHDIIQGAGSTAPQVPGAWGQNDSDYDYFR